jgi:hypothetical protein
MPAVNPPIHPRFTNGELTLDGKIQQSSIAGRPRSPPDDSFEVEAAYWEEVDAASAAAATAAELEFWRGNAAAAAVNGPRTEDDQEWEDNVNGSDQEWNDKVDEAAYEGATAYSQTSYPRSLGYDVPCTAAAAAAEGRRQLREESTLSIAAALELATLDAAAIERTENREIKNRRQQWQYAVSRVRERVTLPVSRVRERLTFGDWTQEEWD